MLWALFFEKKRKNVILYKKMHSRKGT